MTQENNAVTCYPKKEPLVKLYLIAALCIGFGLWCWFDRANYPAPEAWDSEHINEVAGYVFNHYTLYITGPIGLIFAIIGFLKSRLVFIADDEGLGYLGKTKYPWSNIKMLDASELKSKGWIYVELPETSLKLDSYKLENFKTLLGKIEANVPDTKKKV